MPFGAHLLANGKVNFRLWAPSADKVELCLQDDERELRLPMTPEPDGWYGLSTSLATIGSDYCYRIDETHYVPDPASRYQPEDVSGPSRVIDPDAFQWTDKAWYGLPWEDAVFYELHVGTFTEEGTFAGVIKRLDYLVELGITAIQLMPIADFPGRYNWGYDGVLPFAPDSRYGTPDKLKALVASAHAKGLMVFNDVIYSHFGPEGNYLHLYAPAFFTNRFHTPWGDAIDFNPRDSEWVRQFFLHNALYWLEEYHFDGLRLDAVHAIFDGSSPHFLEVLAEAVRRGPGCARQIYLVLENDDNASHHLRPDTAPPPRYYNAQWNDDLHHVLHVLLTGENAGYYQDYEPHAMYHLGRCLTEGFAYQGESSAYRGGKRRGEPCADLPLTAFVSFLQNHDQVGNRALGERITRLCAPEAVRAATAIVLLMPAPPLLFMGQEWACSSPFTYFVDFSGELAEQVAQGRLREFAKFTAFADAQTRQQIPRPNAVQTFNKAKLPWAEINQAPHQQWLEFHQMLLRIRRQYIRPRLAGMTGRQARYQIWDNRAISVKWRLGDGSTLTLAANLGDKTAAIDCPCRGDVLFASDSTVQATLQQGRLEPWAVIFSLEALEWPC